MRNPLADKVVEIKPSGIRKFFDIVSEMKDAISLGVGEPDFDTPWHIREEGIYSLEKGRTSYTSNAGLKELKQEICNYIERKQGVRYNFKDEVLVTVGGSEAIDMALRAMLNPGEEVLIPQPCYVSYDPCTVLAGGVPVVINLKAENQFRLTAQELRDAITDKTKVLILAFPNNPTGAVIGYDELVKICDFVKKHDLFLVTDEVYYNIIFDGEKFWSPAMIDGMKDRTIILQSFSKTYAMTGWRLGYVAGPADVIEAVGLINENSCSCVNTPVQWAGVEALLGAQSQYYLDLMRNTYQERRDIVYKMINEIPGLSCIKPKGAFYAFINIQETGMSSMDFATKLLEKYHVGLVPGVGFGPSSEGFVRMSYAVATDKIIEGINRIAEFMKNEVGTV